MPVPITSIQPAAIQPIPVAGGEKTSGAGVFQSLLSNAMGQVQNARQAADETAARFLSGENQEVHQVALAATQSELAFDLFLQVRNKIVSAYQEVMRMQM